MTDDQAREECPVSADLKGPRRWQRGGYRLPDAARIGAVRLQVGDLARSLVYYTTVLGLRVLSQTGSVAVLGPQGSAMLEVNTDPRIRAAHLSNCTSVPVFGPCHAEGSSASITSRSSCPIASRWAGS